MAEMRFGSGRPKKGTMNSKRLDEVVSKATGEKKEGYREQSLRIHPWVCGRCSKEFNRENLHLMHVHHKDHDHNNNPADGSNWEHLCVYCHDNEHSRHMDYAAGGGGPQGEKETDVTTHNPFADLKSRLKDKE